MVLRQRRGPRQAGLPWAPSRFRAALSLAPPAAPGGSFLIFILLGLFVDHRDRQLGQLLVGLLLLVQRFLQETDRLVEAQLLGPGAGGAVARDLVVLDLLRSGDQAGVQHAGLGVLFQEFL